MIPSAEPEVKEASHPGSWKMIPPNLGVWLILAAAFLLRLKLANESFLNADEALHFMAANQNSWRFTYHASLTISHPPLLIFLLHVWRRFGTSEVILRLPSVLAGTGFCWVFFRWLSYLFGMETGLIGLIFAGFLPTLVALSAEVRQYSLLLFFAICAMYLLQRALAGNSARKMLLSSLFLWLAILSQYSAVLLAAALAVYALTRMFRQALSRAVIAVWFAGQLGALALCLVLYFTYISAFGHPALHSWMDVYLHNSYFDPTRHHFVVFVVTRSISVFQYLLGQNVIGDVMFLLFIAGIVFTVRRAKPLGSTVISNGQVAILLILPFAINCAAALVDAYPYGGTRHCVFLAIFAIAGISFALGGIARGRFLAGIAIAVLIVALCNVFPSRRLPYIAPVDQSKVHMEQALAFIHDKIPSSDLLFVDNQTSLLLGHYLCRQQPFFINEWTQGLNSLQCGGYRIAATDGRVFTFTAGNFLSSWNEVVRAYGLKPGEPVWVLQQGWLWEDTLAHELQTRYPEFGGSKAYSFGHNITIFRLIAGQPMPAL
jgi:uncharacterized membrane protein